MRPDDKSRLLDMLVAAREAMELSSGSTYTLLEDNRTLQLALVKLVEVIGEAASRVTVATRSDLPTVPWSDIIGMRHRLVHDYMSIDLEVTWEVVQDDLPALVASIAAHVEGASPRP